MEFIDFYRSYWFPFLNLSAIFLITGGLLVLSKRKWPTHHSLSASILTFIFVVFFLSIEFYTIDLYFVKKLESFDLDGNGVFSADERTEQQKKYFNIVMYDAGRFLAPFFIAFLSIGYAIFIFFSVKLFYFFKK
ncbi:hypothetical protein J7J47_14115 [Halomonas sp. ISL-60]|uniref:hypothetical protein n=1 Tax=Halomonas sp. ISL-56 TaxID=2819149 RepID=UPI001BEB52B3|nr:hypothetical protein [Halomonas sp. ISL-56]MBT2773359.1 hypothetical protein [Halomonas sp. ISL-60]MBT2802637.1 hypothetical protein [Halomonas sp. ISL-56]